MSNFLQTRGMLAKLLATENLIVEHDSSASTASFNTDTRVLKLPVLKTENENVYNMFVAHECAHALETPQHWKDDIPKGVSFDFVNVIEDVRIERFIQDKFPGLRSDFSKGYDALNQDDFFQILDKDLSKFSFIDRINLHFKLGSRALVPFTEEELIYVKAVDEADTWQKVLLASKLITDYVNDKGQTETPQPKLVDQPGNTDESENQSSQSSSQSNSDSSDDTDEDGDEQQGESEEEEIRGFDQPDELKSETQRAFDEALEDLTDKSNRGRNDIIYATLGDVNVDELIVPIEVVRESIMPPQSTSHIPEEKDRLHKYLTQIKGDVNHMVQQFEMKKSADAYARASQHKTGVLNTNLLHNYKINDDLFLRQSVTPDGKCHGMVMFLDWSGSMSDIAFSTVKQIIVLTQFCRKVQIPFDVYLFTSSRGDRDLMIQEFDRAGTLAHEVVGLTQVLTSKSTRKQIEEDIFHLWCAAKLIGRSYQTVVLPWSPYFTMGGTPLNNALFIVPELIKQFRAKTGAQKVSFVCITDGESAPSQYYTKRTRYNGEEEITLSYPYWEKLMIRTGANVFPIDSDNRGTNDVVRWLRTQLTDVAITNIFLGKLAKSASHLCYNNVRLDERKFKKDGCYATEADTWPLIGVINPNSFGDSQEEIEVEDGASKAKIKSALGKMLKSKQSSRVILTQLVSQFS